MNGILIFLILFLKNIQKIKNPYSFPRRDENGQRQPSHATFPLKDSDKCLRMCCVWLEREFYPSERNRLCHQGRSSILRVYCCREKYFAGLSISGQRTRSQTIFNVLWSLYPTSVPWPVFRIRIHPESGSRHFWESECGFQNEALLNLDSIQMRIQTICPWFIRIYRFCPRASVP